MTKNVWITGASSGIGKALAIKFSSEGWKVAASARRENLLQELNKDNPKICIQTITIIYKKVNGITLNRVERRDITWHSNMELLPNMINFLKKMSIEVEIIFNEKFIPKTSLDRKKLAFFCF